MLTDTDRKGIRDSIKQWSQRRNIPDDVINDFIELALSKANRALRIPPLETFSGMTVDAAGFTELPTDFVEVKELTVETGDGLIILERKHIDEVNAKNGTEGYPCIFGRSGDQFRISPWSDDDEEPNVVTMYYYYAIPKMTDDTDTNWFTQYAPEVLLYGGLAELCNYTRDTEGTQLWTSRFTEAVDILQSVEDRSAWSGSTLAVSVGGST